MSAMAGPPVEYDVSATVVLTQPENHGNSLDEINQLTMSYAQPTTPDSTYPGYTSYAAPTTSDAQRSKSYSQPEPTYTQQPTYSQPTTSYAYAAQPPVSYSQPTTTYMQPQISQPTTTYAQVQYQDGAGRQANDADADLHYAKALPLRYSVPEKELQSLDLLLIEPPHIALEYKPCTFKGKASTSGASATLSATSAKALEANANASADKKPNEQSGKPAEEEEQKPESISTKMAKLGEVIVTRNDETLSLEVHSLCQDLTLLQPPVMSLAFLQSPQAAPSRYINTILCLSEANAKSFGQKKPNTVWRNFKIAMTFTLPKGPDQNDSSESAYTGTFSLSKWLRAVTDTSKTNPMAWSRDKRWYAEAQPASEARQQTILVLTKPSLSKAYIQVHRDLFCVPEKARVTTLSFSPNGTLLLCCFQDSSSKSVSARMWNVISGKETEIQGLDIHHPATNDGQPGRFNRILGAISDDSSQIFVFLAEVDNHRDSMTGSDVIVLAYPLVMNSEAMDDTKASEQTMAEAKSQLPFQPLDQFLYECTNEGFSPAPQSTKPLPAMVDSESLKELVDAWSCDNRDLDPNGGDEKREPEVFALVLKAVQGKHIYDSDTVPKPERESEVLHEDLASETGGNCTIAIVPGAKCVTIWDKTGHLVHVFEHERVVSCIHMSEDGAVVAVGLTNASPEGTIIECGQVIIYSLITMQAGPCFSFPGYVDKISLVSSENRHLTQLNVRLSGRWQAGETCQWRKIWLDEKKTDFLEPDFRKPDFLMTTDDAKHFVAANKNGIIRLGPFGANQQQPMEQSFRLDPSDSDERSVDGWLVATEFELDTVKPDEKYTVDAGIDNMSESVTVKLRCVCISGTGDFIAVGLSKTKTFRNVGAMAQVFSEPSMAPLKSDVCQPVDAVSQRQTVGIPRTVEVCSEEGVCKETVWEETESLLPMESDLYQPVGAVTQRQTVMVPRQVTRVESIPNQNPMRPMFSGYAGGGMQGMSMPLGPVEEHWCIVISTSNLAEPFLAREVPYQPQSMAIFGNIVSIQSKTGMSMQVLGASGTPTLQSLQSCSTIDLVPHYCYGDVRLDYGPFSGSASLMPYGQSISQHHDCRLFGLHKIHPPQNSGESPILPSEILGVASEQNGNGLAMVVQDDDKDKNIFLNIMSPAQTGMPGTFPSDAQFPSYWEAATQQGQESPLQLLFLWSGSTGPGTTKVLGISASAKKLVVLEKDKLCLIDIPMKKCFGTSVGVELTAALESKPDKSLHHAHLALCGSVACLKNWLALSPVIWSKALTKITDCLKPDDDNFDQALSIFKGYIVLPCPYFWAFTEWLPGQPGQNEEAPGKKKPGTMTFWKWALDSNVTTLLDTMLQELQRIIQSAGRVDKMPFRRGMEQVTDFIVDAVGRNKMQDSIVDFLSNLPLLSVPDPTIIRTIFPDGQPKVRQWGTQYTQGVSVLYPGRSPWSDLVKQKSMGGRPGKRYVTAIPGLANLETLVAFTSHHARQELVDNITMRLTIDAVDQSEEMTHRVPVLRWRFDWTLCLHVVALFCCKFPTKVPHPRIGMGCQNCSFVILAVTENKSFDDLLDETSTRVGLLMGLLASIGQLCFLYFELVEILTLDIPKPDEAGFFDELRHKKLLHLTDAWNFIPITANGLGVATFLLVVLGDRAHGGKSQIVWTRSVSALAMIFLWFTLFNHIRPYRKSSALIAMLVEIMKDMVIFAGVVAVLVFAFAGGFYALHGKLAPVESESTPCQEASNVFEGVGDSLGHSFLISILGDFELDLLRSPLDVREETTGTLTIISFIFFFWLVVLVSVVALNALIAIMSETYSRVQQSQRAVTYQQISAILSERLRWKFFKFHSGHKRKQKYESEFRWIHVLAAPGSLLHGRETQADNGSNRMLDLLNVVLTDMKLIKERMGIHDSNDRGGGSASGMMGHYVQQAAYSSVPMQSGYSYAQEYAQPMQVPMQSGYSQPVYTQPSAQGLGYSQQVSYAAMPQYVQ